MFGEGATGTVPGRIGSVVLAAREPVAFVDPALPNERTLKSGHGSLTPDEMYVPLLAARGTSRGLAQHVDLHRHARGCASHFCGVSSMRHTSVVWPMNGDWMRATSNSSLPSLM